MKGIDFLWALVPTGLVLAYAAVYDPPPKPPDECKVLADKKPPGERHWDVYSACLDKKLDAIMSEYDRHYVPRRECLEAVPEQPVDALLAGTRACQERFPQGVREGLRRDGRGHDAVLLDQGQCQSVRAAAYRFRDR